MQQTLTFNEHEDVWMALWEGKKDCLHEKQQW